FVNDIIVKVFTNIVVIVLNYLFSKMIIFRK
ncbi:GtrA family protein, partial [Clostridioides difficile]|nr:GtrA family protein [Clostridioides difficile]